MCLTQVAVKLRATSACKASAFLTFTRSRSTIATSLSFLEARAGGKERARNVAHNVLAPSTVYVSFSSV